MHHGLLVAGQDVGQRRRGRLELGLQQRLADTGDVAVPEDAEAAGEQLLPLAVALGVLDAQESHQRLRDGEPTVIASSESCTRLLGLVIGSLRTAAGGRPAGCSTARGPSACCGSSLISHCAFGAGAGHHVQVVHVVAGRRHRRTVPAVRDQHQVAAADLGQHVDRPVLGAVDPLVADRIVALDTFRYVVGQLQLEVVDLLELALLARLVLVVLVRRVRRPVAGRGEHLAGDDRVRLEDTRRTEVPDLPGGDAGTAQLGLHLLDRRSARNG